MTAWLDLAWMLMVMALIAWLAGNLMALVLVYFVSPSELPSERRQLWLLAALPWLLPATTVSTVIALALAKKMGWIVDHCLFHDPHHPHFCLAHLPQFLLAPPQSLVGAASLLVLLAALTWQMVLQVRQRNRVRALYRLTGADGVMNELEDDRPMAFTTGLRQPIVFLSRGLKKHLTKRQQRIVVAHEFAHIRNKDVAFNTLYEWLLTLHICRKALRHRWHLNTESLADSQVTRRFDPLEVATVLLTLIRLSVRNPCPVSIAGANPQLRIHRLLHPVPGYRFRRFTECLLWLNIALTVLVIAFNHHAVETLMGWLIAL